MCFTLFNIDNSRKLTVGSVGREASRFEAGRTLLALHRLHREEENPGNSVLQGRQKRFTCFPPDLLLLLRSGVTYTVIHFLISAFPMRILQG